MPGMDMDAGGMVMNANSDKLPRDCTQISQDVKITVHAGRKLAARLPGIMYAYDQHVWNVPGCSRVTVTLVNDDHVRHQWMLHGLPRYLYPEGMFHLEVSVQDSEVARSSCRARRKPTSCIATSRSTPRRA